ncbi:replication protein RepB [Bacillus sp. MUM 116]|uniref:replication initiation protein n=1 Tax=Bacillus sp. MUM 116 TaxID=1678002 RepID=UPI0008F55A04|nr:replication initiation protein [Bacillus sp. MUM 116]OIK14231.1 replication protein RepB [Bacillus sp. MUM 116]
MTNENRDIIFKDSNLVSKANTIIEATYKLGVMEQKIISTIASNIRPTDKDFQTYTFSIKQFKDLIGSKSKNIYGEIDKITTKLMQPFLFINAEGKPTRIAWLSKATYNTNEGSVTVRFDPDLKPFFLFLSEKFTRYKLGNIIHLRSSYSIRLYELLKSYEGLTERTFTLVELRIKLGIPDKYPKWINFRQRVLDHAKDELEEKTDITFTYETIKKGRSVEKVKFKIKQNPKVSSIPDIQEKMDKVMEKEDVLEIQKLGKELGLNLSAKLVSEWLQYGKENVLELIDYIKYKTDIKNPIGYVSSVLPKKVKDKEEPEADNVQKAIRQFILNNIPKRKVKRLEYLPDWMMEEIAIEVFKQFMTEEQANNLWLEKKVEIIQELNTQREKMLV